MCSRVPESSATARRQAGVGLSVEELADTYAGFALRIVSP
jgi:hypothetical protein